MKRNTADLSAVKEAVRRVNCGDGLVVFPEGSRSMGGQSFEPQAGIGFLAGKFKIPVIPAFIKGTDAALPKGAKLLRPGKICVYFGAPVVIEENIPYQEIARKIMASIRSLAA